TPFVPARRSIHFCLGFSLFFENWLGSTACPVNSSRKRIRAIAGGFGHTILLTSKYRFTRWSPNLTSSVVLVFAFLAKAELATTITAANSNRATLPYRRADFGRLNDISFPSDLDCVRRVLQVQRIAVARPAEFHVRRLVLNEHAVLAARMRLMAGEAAHWRDGLRLQVRHVRDRMTLRRVSCSVLKRKNRHLLEIVLRQLDLAFENRDLVFGLELLRGCFRTVALETKRVDLRAA